MPRVRRRGPGMRTERLPVDWTLAALDLPSWEAAFGGAAAGRAAWERLRGRPELRFNLTMRAAPFWAYEAGVPLDCRGTGDIEVDYDDAALRTRRLRWLMGAGADHLQAGETHVITRELEQRA